MIWPSCLVLQSHKLERYLSLSCTTCSITIEFNYRRFSLGPQSKLVFIGFSLRPIWSLCMPSANRQSKWVNVVTHWTALPPLFVHGNKAFMFFPWSSGRVRSRYWKEYLDFMLETRAPAIFLPHQVQSCSKGKEAAVPNELLSLSVPSLNTGVSRHYFEL